MTFPISQSEQEELDKKYQTGYENFPEETDLAESQEAMLSEILSVEDW